MRNLQTMIAKENKKETVKVSLVDLKAGMVFYEENINLKDENGQITGFNECEIVEAKTTKTGRLNYTYRSPNYVHFRETTTAFNGAVNPNGYVMNIIK
jgi:hypothetical protein